jgi:acetate kinase
MSARNKVLVLNAGSSSLKFKLYQQSGGAAGGSGAAGATRAAAQLQTISAGLCERIGDPSGGALLRASANSDRWRKGTRVEEPMPDHGAALRLVAKFLAGAFSPGYLSEVAGVGHRVVHGASIGESVLIE